MRRETHGDTLVVVLRIGTSNFRTLVGHQPPEQHGLSIEAMPFYIKELRPGQMLWFVWGWWLVVEILGKTLGNTCCNAL